MKQIKKYFTVKWCAIISALLGMLGYAACGSKEDEAEALLYGQPHADFKVEGAVFNEEGAPINGVRVYVRDSHGMVAKSDQEGKFVFRDDYMWPRRYVWVIAEDPSGVYAADSVMVTAKYEGGDGSWYKGSYSTTQDFKLKKEEPAEPETPETPEESSTPETPTNPEE
ncbi:MAG: radical SAM-associated putative lipoprotein [Bacteroidales bacterium]|nr:radical SAM-associated putative lipoprotein [Bacteroidales bacterium]